MRLSRTIFLCLCGLAISVPRPSQAMNHARRGPTSPRLFSRRTQHPVTHTFSHHGAVISTHSNPVWGARPTQIPAARTTEIQTALIRSGYLSGDASGHWDAETDAAFRKLQGDNGWQTKIVPDSRAIIKLGLGPASAPDAEASSTTPTDITLR